MGCQAERHTPTPYLQGVEDPGVRAGRKMPRRREERAVNQGEGLNGEESGVREGPEVRAREGIGH